MLNNLGQDILSGNLNEYYSPLGEMGGQQFEKYLSGVLGDVQSNVLDSAAATGRSGGAVQASIAEQTGKVSNEARYADYLRTLEGRGNLLTLGNNIMSGVRQAGQQEGANVNNFNMGTSEMDLNYRMAKDQADMALGQAEGEALGDVVGSVQGAIMGAAGIGGGDGGWAGMAQGATGIDWSSLLSNQTNTPKIVGGDIAQVRTSKLGRLRSSDLNIVDYKSYL